MPFTAIGLMTGTSLDGLDIACCQFSPTENRVTWEFLASEVVPMPPHWQNRLRALPGASAEAYALAHVEFAHWLGRETQDFILRHGLTPDLVAAHGQTIFHQPDRRFTAQIGDGETLSSYFQCPVVTNFRAKDVALGGQGAPLVPLGERMLFPDVRLFLNLGGICNLTLGPAAFDVAPCNLALNHLYTRFFPSGPGYDPDGEVAASGKANPQLLAALDALPYYAAPFPKSLGWEWVEGVFLPVFEGSTLPPEDQLATCATHIAGQIARAVEQLGARNESILITGGGQRHLYMQALIAKALQPLGIAPAADAGDWVDFKEAIIFAYLGLRLLSGQSTSLASVTGAPFDVVGGSIHLPAEGGFRLLDLAQGGRHAGAFE